MRADRVALPIGLYHADRVRQSEPELAKGLGIALYQVMEEAGSEAWRFALKRWPELKTVCVLCGGGNNAGDGYILARLARQAGLRVTVRQFQPEVALQGDAARAQTAWVSAGGAIEPLDDTLPATELYVDALVGTGLRGALRAPLANIVAQINASTAPVLAIDIPSGVSGQTGAVAGEAVQACATITFVAVKPGLLTGKAPAYVGELVFAPLQLGKPLAGEPADLRCAKPADLKTWLPTRSMDSHKGTHGRVLILGGDEGMAGAARLAGEAALRCGAGLVRVNCAPASALPIQLGRPELMVESREPAELGPRLGWADVLVVGPGLGQRPWAEQIWQQALSHEGVCLLDADALNLLAKQPMTHTNWVLTPHPGEAARLLGCSTGQVESDRFRAIVALQRRFGGVVVLKGAGSLIYDGQQMVLAPVGNSGLATGGSGDLLSGIIGGLLAQGLSLMDAACAGVVVHGEAADSALGPGPRGMLPSDLMQEIRRWVNVEAL
ncbi:NAD(P)H-hydrate dehydratase [Ferrimonas pelagia]|uniref:Bifunctional NAD(P)H-hydrate repair enzyme n=1 Tax=Ferrimonas pelagia TaxID=1177826 RepID=A0ABP9EG52_9GAMM